MKNQSIFLLGNIASGKTSLANSLESKVSSFKVVCINECRRQSSKEYPNNEGTPHQIERYARTLFLQKIKEHQQVILPMTGGTRFFEFALLELKKIGFNNLLIKIDCPPIICYKRFLERQRKGYLPPPLPYQTKDIKQLIYRYDDKLKTIHAHHVLSSHNKNEKEVLKDLLAFLVT